MRNLSARELGGMQERVTSGSSLIIGVPGCPAEADALTTSSRRKTSWLGKGWPGTPPNPSWFYARLHAPGYPTYAPRCPCRKAAITPDPPATAATLRKQRAAWAASITHQRSMAGLPAATGRRAC